MDQDEKKTREKKQDETKRNRQHRVSLRMTESEYETLKKGVALSGLSQTELLTKCLLYSEFTNTDGVRAILPELKRIGNNVNQISQRLNSGGSVEPEEWTYIRKEFDEVWQLLRQLAVKHR